MKIFYVGGYNLCVSLETFIFFGRVFASRLGRFVVRYEIYKYFMFRDVYNLSRHAI
jgi:hypothetical protein